MIPWTTSARDELQRYVARARSRLERTGADPAEVEDDLRRHIDEEGAAAGLTAITEEDVRRILARMGPAEADSGEVETPVPGRPGEPAAAVEAAAVARPLRVGSLVFGVLLPLLALGIEWVTHMCAGLFFDPLPGGWPVALVSGVPLANFLVWRSLRRGGGRGRTGLAWANAVAMGVALFYSVLFIPLLAPACFAIVIFGWGLLPMTPLFAFAAAWRSRHLLGREPGVAAVPPGRLPGLWPGVLMGFALALAAHLPEALTEIGLRRAVSESAVDRARGIEWLRRFGREQTLLRECYGRSSWAGRPDAISWVLSEKDFVSAEDARSVYYRTTGRAFNTVPPPAIFTGRGRWDGLDDAFAWDRDQGGLAVGGRVKGLSLVASRQDALIEADAALGYVEWVLEFRNTSPQSCEARAQVLLPPGGVVSRLTLWVGGEEREAAFGGRSQVREAYEKVVQQRRDPALVSTCGPDRVLLQCFPVPPGGGTMKVRLGVTAPLLMIRSDEAAFRWPALLERNFTIPPSLQHTLWAESRRAMETPGGPLKSERAPSGLAALRGAVTDVELSGPQTIVRVHRDASVREAWVADSRDDAKPVIRQTIAEAAGSAPERVILVVDGSACMASCLAAIGEALQGFPEGLEFALVTAFDMNAPDTPARVEKGSREIYGRAARQVAALRPRGGQDNVPALVRAWDLAAERSRAAILWIHGPQPVRLGSAEPLRQRFDRRPDSPALYDLQTDPGPNRVAEQLDGVGAVRSVPRLGSPAEDLGRLLRTWKGESNVWTLLRRRSGADVPAGALPGCQASPHLARLWASDEIGRCLVSRRFDDAIALAERYQLVAPVSAAVVLESKGQYQASGLRPVDAGTVPTVPEPSTWVLFGLGLATLAVRAIWRRPQAAPETPAQTPPAHNRPLTTGH